MRKNWTIVRIAAVMVVIFLATQARPTGAVTLRPAEPQPASATLQPGLAVDYAYGEIRFLGEAESWVNYTKPGLPLVGFIYGDTVLGEKTFTAEAPEFVVAFIKDFMKFESGTHELEFQSNDSRHKCQTKGVVRVTAPKTGWYPVTALYFNRKFAACLDLSIRPAGGEWDFTSPEIYAHIAQ